jgi:hypothetical protein
MKIQNLSAALLSFAIVSPASLIAQEAQQAWVALSKVKGINAYKGQVALFGVEGAAGELPMAVEGDGAESFTVNEVKKEGKMLTMEIGFEPAEARGFYAAELVVGGGENQQIVPLRGIATPALEGANEPPLQFIIDAMGVNAEAGGKELSLDTGEATIGSSVAASQFEPVAGETLRVTPVARYSPPGDAPFGFVVEADGEMNLQPIGSLAATTKERPDAHQTLRPPLASGEAMVEVASPPAKFGFYMKGEAYTSVTFPGRSEGTTIQNTARIYPVTQYSGRALTNAYLVGFEEASNGDYQDAVFLIEGVQAVK